MPKGPEIRRAADRVEAAVGSRPAREVYFAFPNLKQYESDLSGETASIALDLLDSIGDRVVCSAHGSGNRAAQPQHPMAKSQRRMPSPANGYW